MKVVILAGGLGTRLSEETGLRPKPLVEVGGLPILWHIMKHYAQYGHDEFFVALGYKGDMVKRYFLDRHQLGGNMTIDLATGEVARSHEKPEPWRVHLVETGADTLTGGRVKRLEAAVGGSTFMVTYGDGVSDVDIGELVRFHKAHGRLATLTAVRPPARFGGLVLDGSRVASFTEKPQSGEGWINGGYLVLEPGIFDYLDGDQASLEADGLEKVAGDGQLMAFEHRGFWQCMDTLRDLRFLQSLWDGGAPPWRVWA